MKVLFYAGDIILAESAGDFKIHSTYFIHIVMSGNIMLIKQKLSFFSKGATLTKIWGFFYCKEVMECLMKTLKNSNIIVKISNAPGKFSYYTFCIFNHFDYDYG